MATPVALTVLVIGDSVGNEKSVAGFDIGASRYALAAKIFGETAGGAIQPFIVSPTGVPFVPAAADVLLNGGTGGIAVNAGATVAVVSDADVFDSQWILGALKFTENCTYQFVWSDVAYNATYATPDDLVTVPADDTFKPDTPRRARYLNVFVHNTSGSNGLLYGHLLAENSGAV
jgi:hypothetical protein